MKIAICLHKFFPFGGLAKDFLNIANICHDRSHKIDIYVMEWRGNIPEHFDIHIVSVRAWTNHGKIKKFINWIDQELKKETYDLVIGFNKIPGLDIYYAADPCYIDRVMNQRRSLIYRLSCRFNFHAKCEQSVFGLENETISLMISDIQRDIFKQAYGTPAKRLLFIPPGILRNRQRPNNWQQIRIKYRNKFCIDDEFLLLMVGTAFKTKAVDRAIAVLASLPGIIQTKIKLFVVGEGSPKPYIKLAKQYGIEKHVIFLGGRRDIAHLLLSADLLIHPARRENAGNVILEAMVAGVPIIISGECGYHKHVINSDSGLVMPIPFSQTTFKKQILMMLHRNKLEQWSNNGLAYAASENLYDMPKKAVNIIEQIMPLN